MSHNLTLDQAISLLAGKDFWHTVEIEELDIPKISMSDGPYGLRKQNDEGDHLGIHDSIKAICFPTSCVLASTFNPDTAFKMGQAIGRECRAEGVNIILGPGINIKRTPIGGRNFEYFSEDPFLTGVIATAFVKGVESMGVGCCLKHFALNNQENARMTISSNVSDRAIQEIYLYAFKEVIKNTNLTSIMSSYNRYNGEYVEANSYLLNDLVRNEWGFKGIIISDWYATVDRVKSLVAGVDIEMPGGPITQGAKIKQAVLDGKISESVVFEAAERVIAAARKLNVERLTPYDKEEHHNLAKEIAAEGAVLLKNDGMLPLSENKKYLAIGSLAANPRYQGGGSSHINSYKVSAPKDFFTNNIKYLDSLDLDIVEKEIKENNYDGILVFAGINEADESEGFDRKTLNLPEFDNKLIDFVSKLNNKIAVILMHGGAVVMPWLNQVSACLTMQLAGEAVGEAVVEVLTGVISPSGRLAETYPLCLEHNPSYINSKNLKNSDYNEGVFVGYRYYETKKLPVLFPFGYGLSYAKFTYSNILISKTTDKVILEVDIKNDSLIKASEIVQVYAYPPIKHIDRPVCELKGLKKVELEANESKHVVIEIKINNLSYFDSDFIVDSGDYKFSFNENANKEIISANIYLEGNDKVLVIDDSTTIGELFENKKTYPLVASMLKGYKMNAEGDAISSDMKQAMLNNAPLRLLKGMAKLDDLQFEGLKNKFRELLK